jgi:hypothetical protein
MRTTWQRGIFEVSRHTVACSFRLFLRLFLPALQRHCYVFVLRRHHEPHSPLTAMATPTDTDLSDPFTPHQRAIIREMIQDVSSQARADNSGAEASDSATGGAAHSHPGSSSTAGECARRHSGTGAGVCVCCMAVRHSFSLA